MRKISLFAQRQVLLQIAHHLSWLGVERRDRDFTLTSRRLHRKKEAIIGAIRLKRKAVFKSRLSRASKNATRTRRFGQIKRLNNTAILANSLKCLCWQTWEAGTVKL